MTWGAVLAVVLKVLKPVGEFFAYIWDELKNDTFARTYFVLSLAVMMFGLYGWWLYWTKAPSERVVTKVVEKVVVKYKPYMGGTVDVKDGKVSASKFDLCLIPKIGAAYVFGEGFAPAASIRFAHYRRIGAEFGVCSNGPLVGLDFQNFILNATTLSAGICPDIDAGNITRPYAKADVAFRY